MEDSDLLAGAATFAGIELSLGMDLDFGMDGGGLPDLSAPSTLEELVDFLEIGEVPADGVNFMMDYMAEELMGLAEENPSKKELLDNPLTLSGDLLDAMPNPFDCYDAFFEPADNEENSSADKNIDTSIAINFSEIMEDLVNLMSLDKEMHDLHQGSNDPIGILKNDSADTRKRPFHMLDDVPTSSLPDHTYHLLHQKKQKVDDSSPPPKISTIGKQPEQEPQIMKNSKYFERRKKNNIASKRSRETRKHHFIEMEAQANHLEEENERLKERIEKLEQLTKQMKEVLVKRLSIRGNH